MRVAGSVMVSVHGSCSLLGVAEQIGSIAVGKDADLVVFNPSRAVPILTIQRGHAVNLEAL